MRFNPQGTLLATAGGSHVELWDLVSHKILAILPVTDWVTDLLHGRRPVLRGGRGTDAVNRGLVRHGSPREPSLAASRTIRPRWPSDRQAAWPSAQATASVFYRKGGNRCTNTTPASPTADPTGRYPDREEPPKHRDDRRSRSAYRLRRPRTAGLAGSVQRLPHRSRSPLPPPSSPPGPGPGGGDPQRLSGRSTDGRHVALTRSSKIYLWTTDHPDHPREPRFVAVLWQGHTPPEIVCRCLETDAETRRAWKAEQRAAGSLPPNGPFRNMPAIRFSQRW